MKKNNRAVITLFIAIIIISLIITACRSNKKEQIFVDVTNTTTTVQTTTQSTTQLSTQTTEPTNIEEKSLQNIQTSRALFIGDSRTVGLAEYGKLDNADFFANVGMTVYNIMDAKVSVPSVGKITLDNLLTNKKYDKIYIMLGINEVGYATNQTIEKYKSLIDFVKSKNPKATIILQSNLHVTQERSNKDKVVNNNAINNLNNEIKKLANVENIYYIDGNNLFDDSNNALAKDKTGDNAHLYAKYYAQWAEWIIRQV